MFFSAVGPNHLRVLEAFFNGDVLVVRTTRNYNMAKENAETLTLLSRWWLGYPGEGNTKPQD